MRVKLTLDKGAIFIHKAQATVQYGALTSPSLGNPPVTYEWKPQNLTMQVEELAGRNLRCGTHHIYMRLGGRTHPVITLSLCKALLIISGGQCGTQPRGLCFFVCLHLVTLGLL